MSVNTKIRLGNPDCEQSDEDLSGIMRAVAESVREKKEAAENKYSEELRQLITSKRPALRLDTELTLTDLRCVLSLQQKHDDAHGVDYCDLSLLLKHIQKRYWGDNAPCNVPSVDTTTHAVWASDYRRWCNSVYSDCFKLSGIAQDERKRRIDAVAYAKTSLELEGVTFSREALIDQQLYVAGLISESDMAALAKERLNDFLIP